MYRDRNKIKTLLEQDRNIFTTNDLSILWGIENKNTLLTTLSRFSKRGILKRLVNGIYSKKNIKDLDPFEIGCAICGPSSYISGESVLVREGVILQNIESITLFGKKNSNFEIAGNSYICRYLNPRYLLNRVGIEYNSYYYIANLERAVADVLHINKNYYFDNKSAVDYERVENISNILGYKYENSK